MEASYSENSMTLPLNSLSDVSANPNLEDLSAIFGTSLIDDLRHWLGDEPGSAKGARFARKPVHNFDVFLGHSSKDALRAKPLADFLNAAGKHVFFSRDSLPRLGSTDYMKTIDDALEGSRHFVLFGTAMSNILSSWVEAEWRLFINESALDERQGIS